MTKVMCRFISLLLVQVSLFGVSSSEAPRPMTVDDVLNLISVDDVIISPDGTRVFYAESKHDWDLKREDLKKKSYQKKKTFYMVRLSNGTGQPVQFIGDAGGSEFRFSPNSEYLSFKRRVDGDSQLFLMRVAGGEAIKVTDHEDGVGSYRWSPDSTGLFYEVDKKKDEESKERYDLGYDGYFVDEGPNGQREESWNSLWTVDIKTRQVERLTDENWIMEEFEPSPDASRIALTARYENRRNQENLSEIYLLELKTGKRVRLTQNEAPERHLRWGPEGKRISFLAPDDTSWELKNEKIWTLDPATRTIEKLTGLFEGEIGDYFWSPDGTSILFEGQVGVNTNLFKLDLAGEELFNLTGLSGTMSSLDMSSDRKRMVYTFSNLNTPEELYVSDVLMNPTPQRLTDLNPWFSDEVATVESRVIRWNSTDGLEIEGILNLPVGHRGGERVPLVLNIHGGPAGSFRNAFKGSYHVYGGLGFASLSPNVRGSTGYSDDFLRGNLGDIGGGDYQDLMTGVDFLIEKGIVDSERLALKGWSYGGILGGWTITQTDRFKAASIGAMVSDWNSEYGPGFNYDVRLWYIGGTPWSNPEGYRQKSPLTYVSNVTTPTIIFHGVDDITDTEPQSMMFFAALKDLGVDVRYVRFYREKHGFREPRHLRMRDIEEIRWLQKYVNGVEWEPWQRSEPEETDGGG